ncbi:glycosyltransferase family 4 protein [Leeuwenhoekiella sp. W20_SRS_FM14]|uniref:glycosyltransferase family 4 protein n=1 Tax=Leeuwenhoekiella sp. W20_SRS_FM14 TaxID=3240270 RepID=UPI003F990BE1
MRFAVITQIKHYKVGGKYYSYTPYIKEMNLWFNHVDAVCIVAPLNSAKPGEIDTAYERDEIEFKEVPAINLTSFYQFIHAFIKLPGILIAIYKAMVQADHIHLRCPGNMGLLGAFVQILFPRKRKTAKYAGNWDPKAKQPWSYRLQKWILSSTLITKNMQVLVYGEWPNQTKNIKPFFTASYTEADTGAIPLRKYDLPLRFLFVGSLVAGKRPQYAIDLVEELILKGFPSELHFYGDGILKEQLRENLNNTNLKGALYFHGNQKPERVQEAYLKSHFLILPSKSEGWPKVVAEAMWWGTIPLVTPVSCVPFMLGKTERGILLKADLEADIAKLIPVLKNKEQLKFMANKASNWSRVYTLDRFNAEIKKLL